MVKKQPKRRAWRKVKVNDVEEAMEDDRLIGKMKRWDRPEAQKGKDGSAEASELFTIDTKGSFEGLSATSRREIARAKLFPPKGPNTGLSATEETKVSRAEGSLGAASKRVRGSKESEVFDLWAAPDPATARKQRARAEEEAAMTVIRRPMTRPSKVPKTLYQKVSAAPPVIPAHEGQSMNPTEEAYEDLACTAAARQLEKEAEADALERKLRPITHELRERLGQDAVKDLDDEAQMKLWRSLTGKQNGDREDEEAGGEGSRDHGDAARKRMREQKSQAQRNREKTRKDLDAKQAQKLAGKKLEKQVGEVGALLKEMKEAKEFQQRRREYRAAHRAKGLEDEAKGVSSRRHRLGRTRFAEEALVVPDAQAAAAGCMRSMPLKASAVKERLASIVRRGLVTAPPEASKSEAKRHKSKANRVKNGRKFVSPLLRDNLLLR
jgi:hypothetical protein